MKGKKNTLLVIALLLLVGLTSGYIASTYAKYASKVDKAGTATVAKWNFVADNQASTFTVDLTKTPTASTLVDKRIAPGTSGSFNIDLSNTTTETGVEYTVKLKAIANCPENLKFSYMKDGTKTYLTPGTGTISGHLDPNQSSETVTIDWEWGFGDSDLVDNAANEADTTAGLAAAGGTDAAKLAIGVEVTGVQSLPTWETPAN